MKIAYPNERVEALISGHTSINASWTAQDFADLAVAAADQAGATLKEQQQIEALLAQCNVITAETITDEQIRELRDAAVARFERGADTKEDRDVVACSAVALAMACVAAKRVGDEPFAYPTAKDRTEARARLTEILNARSGT